MPNVRNAPLLLPIVEPVYPSVVELKVPTSK